MVAMRNLLRIRSVKNGFGPGTSRRYGRRNERAGPNHNKYRYLCIMPPLDVNPPVAPAVAQVNGSSADLMLHCNRATGDATGARWHFVDRAFCRFSVAKLKALRTDTVNLLLLPIVRNPPQKSAFLSPRDHFRIVLARKKPNFSGGVITGWLMRDEDQAKVVSPPQSLE